MVFKWVQNSFPRRPVTTFNLRAVTSPVQVMTYIRRKQQFIIISLPFSTHYQSL